MGKIQYEIPRAKMCYTELEEQGYGIAFEREAIAVSIFLLFIRSVYRMLINWKSFLIMKIYRLRLKRIIEKNK